MKRRKTRGIQIGDLVFPREENEVLFINSEINFESKEDISEMVWDMSPGIVIDVATYSIVEFFQVFVVVGNIVGWTYSDCVKVIRRR